MHSQHLDSSAFYKLCSVRSDLGPKFGLQLIRKSLLGHFIIVCHVEMQHVNFCIFASKIHNKRFKALTNKEADVTKGIPV